MTSKNERATREVDEAQRILKQVEQDSQSLLLGGMPSHSRSETDDAIALDKTEVWGRRIGRTLAIAFAVVILLWFLFPPTGA